MSKRDYYEVLGVGRDVAPPDLKRAYRRLAMKYHPDQNPDDDGAAEKFKALTEAYQVLSDPDKRAAYDRFGHGAPEMGFGGAPVDISSMTDFFESIFGSVFGGAARPQQRRRRGRPGRDLQYDLTIELEEAGTFDFFDKDNLISLLEEAGFELSRSIDTFGDPPQGDICVAKIGK